MTEYSLRLDGFKTKAQVKEFFDWYEGQGEQDATVWFECRKYEGKIDVDFMPVDVSVKTKWEDNTLIGRLKIK